MHEECFTVHNWYGRCAAKDTVNIGFVICCLLEPDVRKLQCYAEVDIRLGKTTYFNFTVDGKYDDFSNVS